jgi:aminoglycoside phosphotransferase family enzyme/predicted kinase
MEPTLEQQRTLVEGLRAACAASGEEPRLLETHISWVLLCGPFAYKIKKAVDFGFLDYSTLERRRRFCEEELRLNRRTAPDLYLAALPIGGSPAQPRFGAEPALEWAVQMRRFDQEQLLDRRLAAGRLGPREMEAIADSLAAFHAAIPAVGADQPFGSPDEVYGPVRDNFPAIRRALGPRAAPLGLEHHEAWAAQRFEALRPLLAARKEAGRVRECHGDLHLGNLVQLEEGVAAFDGIEFNPHLRWIDVANELAFAAMDLEARGRPDLARHLVNVWLERTGDYGCVPLLDFYKHYRAFVRVKVAALRYAQMAPADRERLRLIEELGAYLTLAGGYTRPSPAAVIITFGVTGSGKSRVAGALADHLPRAFRLRSDVERKRLLGLTAEARSGSALGAGLYSTEMSRRTYARLEELAEPILDGSGAAIVDATFLRADHRARFRALAERRGVPFLVLEITAAGEVLQERVTARLAAGRDASEADLEVLRHQLAGVEPLTPEERACTLTIDTGAHWTPEELATGVLQRLGAAASGPHG